MKYIKQHTGSVIMCLFEILVGVLLLIDPVTFTSSIITAFGVVLVITGIFSIIAYFRLDPVAGAASQSLLKGLIGVVAGGFCMFNSQWFIAAFPLLALLYGVIILIAGLAKVQWAVDALRMKTGKWFLPALSAVISIFCAVVVFNNPFATTMVLWMFTGVTLIVEAIFDIFVMIFLGKEMPD